MFIYWDGFEIDGSDTNFNLILPERENLSEIVEYYLSLPIWNKKEGINLEEKSITSHRYGYGKGIMTFEESDKIKNEIKNPQWDGCCSIKTCCLLPDTLPSDLKKEIYKLSEERPGNHGEFKKVKCPGATLVKNYFSLCVSLEFDGNIVNHPIDDKEMEGFVLNWDPLIKQISDASYIRINFNCGPCFIYEYGAYIMTSLGERFPSLGIYGGLDCSGGFMKGCTYSMSIYEYERFNLTLNTEIEEKIKYLIDNKIIKLPSVTFSKYWYPDIKNKIVNSFTLINKTNDTETFALEIDCKELYNIIEEIEKKNYKIDLKTYCKYINLLIAHDYPFENLIYDCACYILLPDENDTGQNIELSDIRKRCIENFDEKRRKEIWPYVGFITITGEKDEYFLELRVDHRMSEYFRKIKEKLIYRNSI